MKVKKLIKFSLVALLLIGLLAYLAFSSLWLTHPSESEICTAVELSVVKNAQARFVDEKEIEAMLKNAHIYPTGKRMKDVNTEKIEETIKGNDFIAAVECYKSSKGTLCISVEQRIPVIYILPDGKSGYFVDAKGKKIPNTYYAANIVTASGNIDESFATTKLAEFGQFLQSDAFWNNQIEQIYVTKDRKGNSLIDIVPRVGDHIVHLGKMDDYLHKLQKLRTFYNKAIGTVGWNKYAKINLEYGNQIICTRHDEKR